jgi:hypothetical protein
LRAGYAGNNQNNMTLTNLIKLSFILAAIGVVLSLASIAVPWMIDTGVVSDSRWQAAGQISSAFAAIFGMLIASAALFAYLKREEVGQVQADQAYQQKLRLEQAIHQYCFFFERIEKKVSQSALPKNDDYAQYNFLILPSLSHLKNSLAEAAASDLYQALGSIPMKQAGGIDTNGAIELIYLHFHIQRMMDDNVVNINDNLLKKSLACLIEALSKTNKENIYKLIHQPLDKKPLEYMQIHANK